MPLPRAGHPTARAVKASAPLKTAARRPCVVVVVVVVRTPTPNYLRQASQNLGKYASEAKCPTGCNRHPEGRGRPTAGPPTARRRAGRPLGRPTLDAPGRPYVPRQRPVGRVEGVGSRGLKGRGREDGGSTRAQGLGGAEGTHRSIHSDCPCPSPCPDLARGCFPPSVFSLPQVVCAIA